MDFDIRVAHLFSALDDAQLQQVLRSCHTLDLEDGQSLFETGDPARRFFLVTRGQIKLFRLSAEGKEKVIDIIQKGNTFAEALMFLEQGGYPVSAAALGAAQVISFDNHQFLDLLRHSTDTCFRLMGTMSQRLRGLIKEIDDLTLQSATARVAAMLLKHRTESGQPCFTLRAPKGVLASRLSVKPETFSRILSNLSSKGIIRVKGQEVEVCDEAGLTELAHLESLIGIVDLPCSVNPCPQTAPRG